MPACEPAVVLVIYPMETCKVTCTPCRSPSSLTLQIWQSCYSLPASCVLDSQDPQRVVRQLEGMSAAVWSKQCRCSLSALPARRSCFSGLGCSALRHHQLRRFATYLRPFCGAERKLWPAEDRPRRPE